MGRRDEVDEGGLVVTIDGVEQTPAAGPVRPSRWRRVVLAGLLLSAVTAVVVGLPLAQTKRKVLRDPPTIVLVVDVSGSMNADDIAPSRLEAARASAHQFVSALPDDVPVGVIAFSSAVRVLAPPTADRVEVRKAIDGRD